MTRIHTDKKPKRGHSNDEVPSWAGQDSPVVGLSLVAFGFLSVFIRVIRG
jgi:hypothetical protein